MFPNIYKEDMIIQGFASKMRMLPYNIYWKVQGGILCIILNMILLSLGGCSQDSSDQDILTPDYTERPSYASRYLMEFNIQVPTDALTRGATESTGGSTDGERLGTDKETLLETANIYFVIDDEVILTLYANSNNFRETATKGLYTLTAEMELNDIKKVIGKEVSIYFIGNPYSYQTNLNHNFWDNSKTKAEDAIFTISDLTQRPLGDFGENGLLMPFVNYSYISIPFGSFSSNVSPSDNDIWNLIQTLFNKSTEDGNIYETNKVISLERAVARIEYQDKRPEEKPDELLEEKNIFSLGKNSVFLQLYTLQPYNINKKSYLFRHTAPGNTEKATTADGIFGIEYGTQGYNWISNPDWILSGGSYTKSGDFLNSIIVNSDANESNEAYNIEGTDGIITIDDEFEARTNGSTDGFHPMCYVTENTLPSTELMKDFEEGKSGGTIVKTPILTKYATGVNFKFIVLNKKGEPLEYSEEKNNYPVEIKNSNNATMPENGKWITITDQFTGEWLDVAPKTVRDKNGIEHTYYFLDYIASIQHNNASGYDPENGDFAPMYYGVVRNNTYQITISKIKGLPLPKDPKSMYLEIDVNVLEWVKRQNDFEF